MNAPLHIPSPERVVDGFERMAREEMPVSPDSWMEANLDLLSARERTVLAVRVSRRGGYAVERAEERAADGGPGWGYVETCLGWGAARERAAQLARETGLDHRVVRG